MENSSKFPLLKLPMLAIQEVLSTMEPFEITAFSQMTPKCRNIANLCLKTRPPFKVVLSAWQHPEINFKMSDSHYLQYKITPKKHKDGLRRMTKICQTNETYDKSYIYADDLLQKWMETFDYIKRYLNVEIIDFPFPMDDFPQENCRIIKWIQSHAPAIPDIGIYGENVPMGDIQLLFNSLKITNRLEVDLEAIGSVPIPPGLKYFVIVDKGEMSLERFLELDSIEIRFHFRHLTVPAWISFLRSWLSLECHRNLKMCTMPIETQLDFDLIMQEIPHTEPNPLRVLKRGEFRRPRRAVEIRRKDGYVATLYMCQYPSGKLLIRMVVEDEVAQNDVQMDYEL